MIAVTRRSTLAAYLWAQILALPTIAYTYPIPRAGNEAQVNWEAPVLSLGPWQTEQSTLSLSNDERQKNIILGAAPEALFVRARFSGAADAWGAVLFRAKVVGERPVQMHAYGFAIDPRRGRVAFLRWDEGGVREGPTLDTEALGGRDSFEVCVWYVGTSFIGSVFDGITKEQLAALAWSDPSYPHSDDSSVGLQVAGSGSQRLRIQLTTAPINATPITATPINDTPINATPITATPINASPIVTRPFVTDRWLVLLERDTVGQVPPTIASSLQPTADTSASALAFVTSETTVTALREQGVPMLESHPGVPFKYRVPNFFVRAQAPVSSTPGAVQFNEGLKDEAMITAHLRAYAEKYLANTRLEVIGHSVEKRPILALRIANDLNDTTRPTVLLCAAHHANEAITPEMVLDAIRFVLERPRDQRVQKWLDTFTLIAVPMVNPDGSHAFWHENEQTGRTNRRPTNPDEPQFWGVDLNRNYPFRWGEVDTRFNSDIETSHFYRGPHAGSEPETQAMMQLGQRERFLAAVTYHAAATKILVPYTSGNQPNPTPSAAWVVAEELVGGLRHRFRGRRYEVVRSLYEVNGTDQDWFHHEFGTVALLVEAPYLNPTRTSQIREATVHSRHVWQYLMDRWLMGPSLSVHTTDATTGDPIEAAITIDGVVLGAGENWTTRPDNGWLHQYLVAPGKVTVHARAGGKHASTSVQAARGVTVIELKL